jgi:REP element-mobilizing transposase RayT
MEERAASTKRGGWRLNAGRKKTGRCRDAPHRTRPPLTSAHPVHVVLRTRRDDLRCGAIHRALRPVLQGYLGRADFRVVHLSIQRNHLHLLVEASDAHAFTRGMQSFAINAARAINASDGGCGRVFAYRYHASQIKTARYARNALAYVLNNWRRHRLDYEHAAARNAQLDPYASGLAFDGWTRRFNPPRSYEPLPVSPPRTRLLAYAWRRYGPVDPRELPGPLLCAWRL